VATALPSGQAFDTDCCPPDVHLRVRVCPLIALQRCRSGPPRSASTNAFSGQESASIRAIPLAKSEIGTQQSRSEDPLRSVKRGKADNISSVAHLPLMTDVGSRVPVFAVTHNPLHSMW
jgi:hypothetical protein